jgi:predicted nucleotidyltransferase component of viral defense system
VISIEELRRIARIKGLKMGNAEKDYIIDIALLSISRNTKDEMVFKGGTCLSKFYKIGRFSEDIDFTLRKELDIGGLLRKIVSDLRSFGMESEIRQERRAFNSIMSAIRTKGPLYRGTPNSVSSLKIDINTKSSIDMEPLVSTYNPIYTDIPSFSLPVMQEKEILAEKVRAIMTRAKARDVYDVWFLLGDGVPFDTGLIEKKLKYYGEQWNPAKFRKSLNMKEPVWETELVPLISGAPPRFAEARKLIIGAMKKG